MVGKKQLHSRWRDASNVFLYSVSNRCQFVSCLVLYAYVVIIESFIKQPISDRQQRTFLIHIATCCKFKGLRLGMERNIARLIMERSGAKKR